MSNVNFMRFRDDLIYAVTHVQKNVLPLLKTLADGSFAQAAHYIYLRNIAEDTDSELELMNGSKLILSYSKYWETLKIGFANEGESMFVEELKEIKGEDSIAAIYVEDDNELWGNINTLVIVHTKNIGGTRTVKVKRILTDEIDEDTYKMAGSYDMCTLEF